MDAETLTELTDEGQVRLVKVVGGVRKRTVYLCTEGCGRQSPIGKKCHGCESGKHRRPAGAAEKGEFIDESGHRRFSYGTSIKYLCIGNGNTCQSRREKANDMCKKCRNPPAEKPDDGFKPGDIRVGAAGYTEIKTESGDWRKKCNDEECKTVVKSNMKFCTEHKQKK